MTVDVFERYASLDPAKAPGIQPEWSEAAPVLSALPHGREPNMQTQQLNHDQEPNPSRSRTGLLVAAAALALVMIVGAIALILNNDASDLEPASMPPTTVATDAAPGQSPTPSEAIAVANAWYVAHNSGDIDAVMDLFAPDAAVSDNFSSENHLLEDLRMEYIWDAAQGTQLTMQGCEPIEASALDQTVRCTGTTSNALHQAVDAPPVRTTVTMTVGPDGITRLTYLYGSRDFLWVGEPFITWMTVNHPEVGDMSFGTWGTAEEAEALGVLWAQYATEWANYLDEKDCGFRDRC